MTGLSTITTNQTETKDYVANMIYENNTLKRILVDGGYIEDGNYYFYVRDHLGNNRIIANREGSVLQSTEYYPFGLEFANGIGKGLQPYKYGNKELDSGHNLNLYDFVARYMNPAVPRFTSVDPHAENYYSWSPYHYAANNPLRITDPTGEDWQDVLNGVVDGAKERIEALAHAVSHPIETVKNMVTQVATPKGILLDAADKATLGSLSTTINLGSAIYSDINGGDGSATGKAIGETLTNVGVAAATAKGGQLIGKGVSNLSNTLKSATKVESTVSPNVQNVLKSLKELQSEGGSVKLNNLKTTQEVNMTIQKGTEKINLRIESHIVEKKFGGNGTSSQRHMNVDYYKNGRRKTNNHTILE